MHADAGALILRALRIRRPDGGMYTRAQVAGLTDTHRKHARETQVGTALHATPVHMGHGAGAHAGFSHARRCVWICESAIAF